MNYRQYYLSPLGLLAISASQKQIVSVSFAAKKQKSQKNTLTQKCVRQLEQYFANKRQSFALPLLLAGTYFQKQVYQALLAIPYGRIISYSDLAQMIGRPKAARAMGSALSKNPIAIVVPCHRVLASGGKLGGYSGGLSRKRRLLAWEKHFD